MVSAFGSRGSTAQWLNGFCPSFDEFAGIGAELERAGKARPVLNIYSTTSIYFRPESLGFWASKFRATL